MRVLALRKQSGGLFLAKGHEAFMPSVQYARHSRSRRSNPYSPAIKTIRNMKVQCIKISQYVATHSKSVKERVLI